jgi:DNA topoisomerase I
MRSYLNAEEAAVYDLIWKRTVASQMESAEFERTTVDITAQGNDGKRYGFRATGAVVRFDGFLRLYQEGRDDEDDEASNRLPAMARGDRLGVEKIVANQHFTEPPPRYSEASLIKKLEELGIGRPSTYTAILVTLRERGYVQVDKKRLVPEDKGRLVTAFLEAFFRRYVEYDFTANLEEQLDRISAGEIEWKSVLRDFWRDFIAAVDDIKDLRVSAVLDALNDLLEPHIFPPREDGAPPRQCPSCEAGQLSLKIGRSAPSSAARTIPTAAIPASSAARTATRRACRPKARCSAPIRRPACRSRSTRAASGLTCSAPGPTTKSPTAPRCPRA